MPPVFVLNDDTAASLDHLLHWLDMRYGPVGRRTMIESKWRAQFEADKMEFRRLVLACLTPAEPPQ